MNNVEKLQDFKGPLSVTGIIPLKQSGKKIPSMFLNGQEHIFQNGHVLKQLDKLKGPSNPYPGDSIRLQSRDVFSLVKDTAICGWMDMGNTVKKGALPRAVGADNRY
jgi:hypothetical protein